MAWSHDCVTDGDTDNCGACQDEKKAFENIQRIAELLVENAELKQKIKELEERAEDHWN